MLLMERNSDQDIVDQLKKGSEDAFKEFYLNEQERFLGWCENELNFAVEEALDFYQEAQMFLYENIIHGKLNELNSQLSTYLYAIAKNQIKIRYRKLATQLKHDSKLVEHLSFLGGIEDLEGEKQSKVQQIKAAIKTMLDPCKTLLTLFYYEGLSFKIIAKRMQYKNESVAKNQKKRCLDRLRQDTQF